MHEVTRSRISQYFQSLKLPEWLLVAASVAVLALLTASGWGRLLAAAALVGAGAYGYRFLASSPIDAEIDSVVAMDIAALEKRALARCHLEESEVRANPQVIVGPRYRRLGGAEFGFRRGEDGKARFTPLHVTIVNFTEHQLVVYQCALDLTTGKPLNEESDEFFYNAIANVALRCIAYTYDGTELDPAILQGAPALAESAVNGKIQIAGADFFRLTTTAGSSVEIMLNEPKLIEQLSGGEMNMAPNDAAVSAIYRLVREKQLGALPVRSPTI